MKIEPYQSVGIIQFKDSVSRLTEKLRDYNPQISEKKFMGKSSPMIYIESLDLVITFKEDGNSIDYIESFKYDLVYDNTELLSYDYNFLVSKFESLDSDLIKESDGFRSDKLGIGIYWDDINQNHNPKSVIVYSEGHYDNPIDPNDIINYYLNRQK